MSDYTEELKSLAKEHQILQFEKFNCATALEIGLKLIEKAKKEAKSITIDISKSGQQLFHYAFENTSPDNDQWIKRKNNIVKRFYKSSFYMATLLKSENKTLFEMFGISTENHAPFGGAFPIRIKNVGVVGTITVSGLPDAEDHKLVTDVIQSYLAGAEHPVK